MTALRSLSSALGMHEDPPSPPSDDFQFESEYVKSLLKQRTPSPITNYNSSSNIGTTTRGKENIERWRTPVTIGAASGRTALAQRDMNSGLTRSQSVMGMASKGEDTPGVKMSSSYVLCVTELIRVDNLFLLVWLVVRGIRGGEG